MNELSTTLEHAVNKENVLGEVVDRTGQVNDGKVTEETNKTASEIFYPSDKSFKNTSCFKHFETGQSSSKNIVSDSVSSKDAVVLDDGEFLNTDFNVQLERIQKDSEDEQEIADTSTKAEVLVLSGNSAANESEISSGPLFRTPLEPKQSRDRRCEIIMEVRNSSRSLRSKTNKSGEPDAEFNDISTDLTPESTVTFGKSKQMQKTYSKKDRGVKKEKRKADEKDKKTKEKVSEWLEHLPDKACSGEGDFMDNVKSKKAKEFSKTSLRILEDEKKMGNKIKHLAEQIGDKNKDLIFNLEDFNDRVEGPCNKTELHKSEESSVEENEMEKTKSKSQSYNQCFVEEMEIEDLNPEISSNNVVQEVCKEATIPVQRKRIFKTKSKVQPKPDLHEEESIKENPDVKGVNKTLVYNKALEDTSALNNSDPYEFKSSQPTPVKTSKLRSKQQRKRKTSTALKIESTAGKKDQKKRHLEVIIPCSKAWNKDSAPKKAILKQKFSKALEEKEVDVLAEKINEAENYDLIASTQEAGDRIERDSSKKVRFSEPIISDFVEPGRINIKGYRDAKKQFEGLGLESSRTVAKEKNTKFSEEILTHNNNVGVENDQKPAALEKNSASDDESGL